jgi:hypothetical protein
MRTRLPHKIALIILEKRTLMRKKSRLIPLSLTNRVSRTSNYIKTLYFFLFSKDIICALFLLPLVTAYSKNISF